MKIKDMFNTRKMEDLKCCGNCVHFVHSNLVKLKEYCLFNSFTKESRAVCDSWVFDGVSKEDRRVLGGW